MEAKWNSRKIIFGLILIAVGVAIDLISPRGLSEVMAMFLGSIGLTYFVGNVGEHFTQTLANKSGEASTEEPVVNAALDKLNARLDTLDSTAAAEKEKYLMFIKGIVDGQSEILKKQDYIISRAGLDK